MSISQEWRSRYRFVVDEVRRRLRGRSRSDVVQETMLRAHRTWTESKAGHTNAWLTRIVKHVLIDRFRKRRIGYGSSGWLASLPDPGHGPVREAELRDLRRHILARLALLPTDEQTVVVLHFLENLSTEEIADAVGKPEHAVRRLKVRALRRLRDLMENLGPSHVAARDAGRGPDNG